MTETMDRQERIALLVSLSHNPEFTADDAENMSNEFIEQLINWAPAPAQKLDLPELEECGCCPIEV